MKRLNKIFEAYEQIRQSGVARAQRHEKARALAEGLSLSCLLQKDALE
jgi:hypothetical protein